MNRIPQQEVRDLVNRITEKSSKEERLQSCQQLCMTIMGCTHIDELNNDWHDIADKLASLISARHTNLEVKKAVGKVIAQLAALAAGSEFVWFLTWVEQRYRGSHVRAEDERAIFVTSLYDCIENVHLRGNCLNEPQAEAVILFVLSSLDKNDSRIVLLSLLDLMLSVASRYSVFAKHFQEAVDFTIGWFVESSSSSVIDKCTSSLIQLTPFWAEAHVYAKGLTSNFIDDIHGYIEDYLSFESKWRSALPRARAIMRALSTVLGIYVDMGAVPSAVETVKYAIKKFLVSSHQWLSLLSLSSGPVAEFFTSFSPVLTVAIRSAINQNEDSNAVQEMVSFGVQLFQLCSRSPEAMSAFADFFAKLTHLPGIPSAVLLSFAESLIAPSDGIITTATCLYHSVSQCHSVTRLLSSLLSPVDLPLLQATYGFMRDTIIGDVTDLIDPTTSLAAKRRGEVRLIVYLNAFSHVATLKNSLIVMMGLRPSLLSLLLEDIPTASSWSSLANNHPVLLVSLLKMVILHVQAHDFFLANSEWLTDGGTRTSMVVESLTGKNAQIQLDSISQMLPLPLGDIARSLVADWLSSLLSRLNDVTIERLRGRPEWRRLRQALTKTVLKGKANESILSVVYRLRVLALVDENDSMQVVKQVSKQVRGMRQKDGVKLWNTIDSRHYISSALSISSWEDSQMVQTRISPSSFSSEDFLFLTNFLLKRIVPSYRKSPLTDDDWLLDSIHQMTSSAQKDAKVPSQEQPPSEDIAQKWRWALAQMASYCIESRMKTSLGKPMDTFNQFGAEIHRLAKEALGMGVSPAEKSKSPEPPSRGGVTSSNDRRRQGDRVHNEEVEDDDGDFGKDRSLSVAEEWWRVRCLLEFIELLDKLIYNAHSGAMFPICTVSQLARQFFSTNIASCREWLCRTYSQAMIVAFHAGYYSQVVRFGTSALSDLEKRQSAARNKEGDVSLPVQPPPALAYAILGWMARAMAELGAEQGARGLRQWASRVYEVEIEWLDGAALMATGSYEQALSTMRNSLTDPALPDSAKKILREMCLDCLNRLRVPLLLEPNACPPSLSIWDEAEKVGGAMPAGFDADAILRVKQLSSFGKPDRSAGPSPAQWDLSRAMDHLELQLMQTLRRTDVQLLRDDLGVLGRSVMCLDAGLRLHGRVASLDRIATAVLTRMGKKTHSADVSQEIVDDLNPLFLIATESKSDVGERLSLARKMGMWAERLVGGGSIHGETARLARKAGNSLLSSQLLHKATTAAAPHDAPLAMMIASTQRTKTVWPSGDSASRCLQWTDSFMALARAFEVDAQKKHMEMQAMMTGDNQYINGFEAMALNGGIGHGAPLSSVPPHLLSPNPSQPSSSLSPSSLSSSSTSDWSPVMARCSLRLSQWLEEEPQSASQLPPNCAQSQLWARLQSFTCEMNGDLVGGLLATACQMAPQLAKAHLKLADWAYKSADAQSADKQMFDRNYRVLLGQDISQSVLDSLWDSLCRSSSLSELDMGIMAAMPTNPIVARSLLVPSSHLLNLWSQMRHRRSVFYQCAISEYFAFISHSGEGSRDANGKSSIGSVSATLRILGLLVKHADLLHASIDQGLETTNELLWKDILPQLFSRLSHPVREVRQSILGLLSRLCRSSPHSLVFQVVAGSSASSASLDETQDDVMLQPEEDEENRKDRSLMLESCLQLSDCLHSLYPSLVRDVTDFVAELQKINLLYEERWVFVLLNLDHEVGKRLDQMRSESERTWRAGHLDETTKTAIVAEKTRLIFTSVYRILTDLYERTVVSAPSTSNERAFVSTFGEQLRQAFEISKANRKSPEKAWAPFKQVLNVLQQRNSRRGGNILHLGEISEKLANLSKSSVPLPGQESIDYSQVVTLSGLGQTIQVLPTKTRPKKMVFVGSDGREQMFLFKGQEDLHLDERIMQLLHICNLMLGGSAKRSWPSYTARHYAVTPLGTRSGLIQWVAGATPLFHIYRKWQVRQAQMKQSMEKRGGVGVALAAVEVERPTDLYQKALRTAFASHNVEASIVADRSKWPPEVLREVLKTMMRETPKDLLSRELWLRAGSSDAWWRVTARFARSCAVMSMVGAVLGLGDRHLDNLLVSLDGGDIVHIDYNICFDKGKNLRVPETVPFRLTQNMANAMGPTQIEGVFRESCSHVLSTLRGGREVLLTVLDAFVYDPLVDWAAADHLTSTSAAVGVAVTLAVYGTDSRAVGAKPVAREMFSVRVKELLKPWKKNCSDLWEALTNVKGVLEKEAGRLGEVEDVWNSKAAADQERVEAGRRLKMAISGHHNMMKDFRPLLRALATCDDSFSLYLRRYRQLFSEPLVRGHQLLDSQPVDLISCLKLFDVVLDNLLSIYDELILLDSSPLSSSSNSRSTPPTPMTPSSLAPPPGLEDSTPMNQQQEQNAHARSVVRRVRERLEGAESKTAADGTQLQMDPTYQADSLIRQATSTSLLSLMYEGWTAWV